jgi:hypothetical protein
LDSGSSNRNTPGRHALALPARQFLRFAFQQRVKLQHAGRLAHAQVHFRLRGLRQLQAETDVVIDRHVREQRVALEHHCHPAVGWRHVVDDAAGNAHLAAGGVFQAGDDTQQRRLAAAGRPQEHAELVFADVQVDVADDVRITSIRLAYASQ